MMIKPTPRFPELAKPRIRLKEALGQKLLGASYTHGYDSELFLVFENGFVFLKAEYENDIGAQITEKNDITDQHLYELKNVGLLTQEAYDSYEANRKEAQLAYGQEERRKAYEKLKQEFEGK